ncbi:PPM-type phosphatase-like domain, partial [Dillenia turbinata]
LVGGRSSSGSGKGRSQQGPIKYGFSLVKGKANHPMEDYHVAKFVQHQGRELGLFAIYDGHLGDTVPAYLQKHLFSNILKEVCSFSKIMAIQLAGCFIADKLKQRLCLKICGNAFEANTATGNDVAIFTDEFWTNPSRSISKAYERTDQAILSHSPDLGRGGSTAVNAIIINGRKLWVANVGDSRAVLSKRGVAIQMTTDHEPNTERVSIEDRGGFVSNMPAEMSQHENKFLSVTTISAGQNYVFSDSLLNRWFLDDECVMHLRYPGRQLIVIYMDW